MERVDQPTSQTDPYNNVVHPPRQALGSGTICTNLRYSEPCQKSGTNRLHKSSRGRMEKWIMSCGRCEAVGLSWTTTTHEVGENYRGVLTDLTYGFLVQGASQSNQRTYDDLLAVCRHHRQQPECPPTLGSSREGFELLRAGPGLTPGDVLQF